MLAARTKVDAAATSQQHTECALAGQGGRTNSVECMGRQGVQLKVESNARVRSKEAAMRTHAGSEGHLTAATDAH
jgi:hypothetical protein